MIFGGNFFGGNIVGIFAGIFENRNKFGNNGIFRKILLP
jgi:hypothetical protein